MEIKQIVAEKIVIEGYNSADIKKMLLNPPEKNMGDLSLPCFSFAKTLHKSPVQIANDLKENLSKEKFVSKCEILNGYLNIFLDQKYFTKVILDEVLQNLENYGKGDDGKGKLACIEFSSINVAKNPHIGHFCCTVYGESFCRLHENFGYEVKRLNYLGDYGTQFGKMITGYLKWGNKDEVIEKGVDALQALYIKSNKMCEEDENYLNECRQTFLKLEQGDQVIKTLYDWFVNLSVEEAKRVMYEKLDIKFDDWRGEAYSAQFNEQTLKLLEDKKLLTFDDGALLVDLTKYNLEKVLVKQTSGASLYATRDISTLLYRYKEYHYDKMLYVTAVQQQKYFQNIFKIGELLGLDYMDKVFHTIYGMVSLPEGKISSRKGAIALVKDFFKIAIEKANEVLSEKGTNCDDKDRLSEQIGIGALTFTILRTSANKDSVFDIKSAVSFDGETGPYLQYTYARTNSILKKATINESEVDFDNLSQDAWDMVKLIEKYPSVLRSAFLENQPSYLARFALDLASLFNKFYNENRIITDDKNKTTANVCLTKIINKVLKKCLYFLVMAAPEKM